MAEESEIVVDSSDLERAIDRVVQAQREAEQVERRGGGGVARGLGGAGALAFLSKGKRKASEAVKNPRRRSFSESILDVGAIKDAFKSSFGKQLLAGAFAVAVSKVVSKGLGLLGRIDAGATSRELLAGDLKRIAEGLFKLVPFVAEIDRLATASEARVVSKTLSRLEEMRAQQDVKERLRTEPSTERSAARRAREEFGRSAELVIIKRKIEGRAIR